MVSSPPTPVARTKPGVAVTGYFLIAGLLGIALTIFGELTAPLDVDNAIAVGQTGLLFLAGATAIVVAGVRWPRTVRWLLPLLAVLTPLTAVAYFLPLGWMLGCAGVALAWGVGILARGSARGSHGGSPHTRLTRACALICAFVAAAWFLVYLSAVVTS
ncbi:hypothetical protein AB0M20_20320 [Actinoplanes sp. NPDC051633]|uniref:hypothetical protein n=1 Tax=Actinoplanes sp. NPDC051633 TaxID=3155670 RepID=UPI00343F8517